VKATRINHVAISATDLEESVRFYEQLFGMERIPTYTFAFPNQYLRLGDQQIHVFERPTSAAAYHHVAFDVDDFLEVYERARELGINDEEAFFSDIYELPDGSVQLYIRDPGGNLIEVNWPDVTSLDRSRLVGLRTLAVDVQQRPDSEGATIYHTGKPLVAGDNVVPTT
jgi:lactoylglutathione lyase